MPSRASCSAASSLRMPSWNQTDFGLAARMSSRWGGDVARAAEDVDHVDGAADGGELADDWLSEDLRDFRVVDGNRNDFVTSCMHVRRNVVRCLIGVRFGLDSENGDRFRLANDLLDPRGVLDQVPFPVFHLSPSNEDEAAEVSTRGITFSAGPLLKSQNQRVMASKR